MENLDCAERFFARDWGDGGGEGTGYGYEAGWGRCSDDQSILSENFPASGHGDLDGSGLGCGDCSGCGLLRGDGDGLPIEYAGLSDCCNGDGLCRDIKSYCGQKVFTVDGVPVVINYVKDNIAQGQILRNDLTTDPCYILRLGDVFACGYNLNDAMDELHKKVLRFATR